MEGLLRIGIDAAYPATFLRAYRESNDKPILNAFCRVAPSKRFGARAMLAARVFFLQCTFNVRRWAVVQARRLISALIGPGDRKGIQPMANRPALGDYDQLHHFIAAGVWDAVPVETELLVRADSLVGDSDAVHRHKGQAHCPFRPRFAYGSPTDHHSGTGTRVNNICQGTKLG
jgi:hypothetical protein